MEILKELSIRYLGTGQLYSRYTITLLVFTQPWYKAHWNYGFGRKLDDLWQRYTLGYTRPEAERAYEEAEAFEVALSEPLTKD